MSTTLNPALADRRVLPYAVGVRLAGETAPTFTHFATKAAAALYAGLASLMPGEDNVVTRWVALTEPEYLSTAVVPGWRQVSYFVL